MAQIQEYTENSNLLENLLRDTSLVNVDDSIDSIAFDQMVEELPSGLLGSGVFAVSGTNEGIAVGVDKPNAVGYIQSRNFVTGTTGWRIDSNGDVEFDSGTFRGTITATTGSIGGFDIGADYVRDVANSMGLASTVSVGDDVRFWAGDTFANRATAAFRVTEAGAVNASNLTVTGGSISIIAGANTVGFTPAGVNAIFSGTTGSPQFRVTPAGAMTATSGTFGAWTIDTNGFSTTGNNIFVGLNAGDAITTGLNNTVFGQDAGDALTEGIANVFIGQGSGGGITTGNYNVLLGFSAGINITTGASDIVIGNTATLGANAIGDIVMGNAAGALTLTGTNNIIIGTSAGQDVTSGTDNIIIGRGADVNLGTLSASIALGYGATITGLNQMVIGSETSSIDDLYIGEGVTSASPTTQTLIHATGGSGANVVGGGLVIAGGQSTGSAAGGSLLFATSPAGGAGSALNALVTALTIDSTGLFTFAGAGAMNFASKSMTNVNIDSGTINGITDLAVADGGTGLSTISALSIWLANSANVVTELTPGAGNSLRINAGGTAWEGYTPTTGNKISTVTTDVTVGNTVTETNLISVSIPANTLGTNNAVKAKLYISDFDYSTTTTSNIAIRLKYGTTTLATANIKPFSGSVTNYSGYIEVMLLAVGATNSQEGSIEVTLIENLTAEAGEDTTSLFHQGANGTAVEDSTGALNLIVSAQWDSAEAGDKITLGHAIIEKIT